jgi:hypothetical protein
MEQNFQTSFIPKKPMIEERVTKSRPISLFVVISVFVLIAVLVASGGLYFYKGMLSKNIATMKSTLEKAKNRFEPAKITQLQVLDKRLQASSVILSQHLAISPIFKALQDITMKTVRYTKFSYDLGTEKNPKIKISMSGQAIGYRSIALQADLFTKNKNLIDPVFSNLSLNEKGNVIFDLEFYVDPNFINYKQTLTMN